MRKKTARAEKRAALSESSGLTNRDLLELLLALEIDSETLAALTLIPLVEVAWADGSIAQQERDAILAAADSVGITPESESYLLLDHWLKKAPPDRLLEAWESYVAALSETLTPEAPPDPQEGRDREGETSRHGGRRLSGPGTQDFLI